MADRLFLTETTDAKTYVMKRDDALGSVAIARIEKISGQHAEYARLFVAAPGLLAAARSVLHHDERGQGIGYAEAMRALAAAVAKAGA
jgi:hypothetical protein